MRIPKEVGKLRNILRSAKSAIGVEEAGIELPQPVVPLPIMPPSPEQRALFSTEDDWAEATRRLVRHKTYGLR